MPERENEQDKNVNPHPPFCACHGCVEQRLKRFSQQDEVVRTYISNVNKQIDRQKENPINPGQRVNLILCPKCNKDNVILKNTGNYKCTDCEYEFVLDKPHYNKPVLITIAVIISLLLIALLVYILISDEPSKLVNASLLLPSF